MKRFTTLASMLCGLALLAGASQAVTIVDPSDPNIFYTGRWSIADPSEPWCYWIGTSIIANFEGTGIAATISAGYLSNPDYLRIIIDDDAANSTKIAVGTSTATYALASDLADGVHKVEIIKETDVGYWTIYQFELDDDKLLAEPPPRPSRRMEFYGDSNLAGYSLESEENESGSHLRGSYRGYAGIASRMFDAEYHNISRSGAGISDIHSRFDRIDYWSTTPTWNFSDFEPDVVLVGLGANDVGLPVHRIKDDYHAFLDDLRAVHPDAHIMLYNGWGWDYDEPANYTDEVIAERDDPNMSSAIFPWIFEQWHGCEYDHGGMAQILADHLSSIMGWSQVPGDVMNGFGMNGDVANGSFEEAAPFDGYGWRYCNASGVSRVNDPAEAYEGSYYLRLADGAASHQPIPAEDGEAFVLTAWMRGVNEGDGIAITIDFRDQEMWTTPLQTTTETKTLSTDWQQYSMTATAPTGTPNPVFHTRVTFEANAGDTAEIDGVVMSAATGVAEPEFRSARDSFSAYPNPFHPGTGIVFRTDQTGPALLTVHDVRGRHVATLPGGQHPAGEYVTTWNARDENDREVRSGIYYVRMVVGASTATRMILLLR